MVVAPVESVTSESVSAVPVMVIEVVAKKSEEVMVGESGAVVSVTTVGVETMGDVATTTDALVPPPPKPGTIAVRNCCHAGRGAGVVTGVGATVTGDGVGCGVSIVTVCMGISRVTWVGSGITGSGATTTTGLGLRE